MIALPLQKDRILIFNKQVEQDTIGELSKQILEICNDDVYVASVYAIHNLEYKPKPIKVYIDSYGGTVYQCLGLLGIVENAKTPVHTIVTGCALSCGFLIAISGHKRFAYKGSTFLYHQVGGGEWGKLKDRQEGVEEAQRLQKIIEEHTLRHTKIPKNTLKEILKRDIYFDAKTCLKYGLVDKIIE
jgi:ATP-dependent Clp protease protease subunit